MLQSAVLTLPGLAQEDLRGNASAGCTASAPPARPAPMAPEQFVARRMTLRHARVLLAVLETGGVSAAADRLNVTQPAVSKALAEVEDGLGAPLFVGSKRNPRPTLMCSRLAALARKLEANLQRAADEVSAFFKGGAGELMIGTTGSALHRVIPEVVVAMKAEFPSLTLNIATPPAARLFDDLRAGQLDLVIARVPRDEYPADLKAVPLGPMQDVLVVGHQHPSVASVEHISWESACESTWLWPLKGTRKREQQDRFWRRNGLPRPRSTVEVADGGLALALLQRQRLFAVLPLHTAQQAVRQGAASIVPLPVDLGLGDLVLWHLDEPQSPVVERLKGIATRAMAGPV